MFFKQSLKYVIKNIFCLSMIFMFSVTASLAQAQQTVPDVEEIRWKSEAQVRKLLGQPNSIHGPIGTHASYTLWKYDKFTVAFADNRAFHLFDKNSLHKIELQENR